jgi:glycosyltransferase involved in cell wall biosynthesis
LGGGREATREQFALPALLRRLDADVLLSPANRGLPLVAPCPMVLVLHDVADWEHTDTAPRAQASGPGTGVSNVVSLSRAALIVTTSQFTAGAIARRLKIGGDRVRVVPGGVDERFFSEPEAAQIERVRSVYGVVPGSILHVGSLKSRRDLPTLVRAVASLDPEVAPRLVLAGSGPEAEGLRSMARIVGAADRLHLAGFVDDDDLPAVYRASRCVVLAGAEEGFGLPALEAMASGSPVIVARAGALPEVVDKGGRFFQAGDARALANELTEVLSNPDEASRMILAGRERAHEFSWDRAARGIESVLRAAVDQGSRSWRSTATSLRMLPRWMR